MVNVSTSYSWVPVPSGSLEMPQIFHDSPPFRTSNRPLPQQVALSALRVSVVPAFSGRNVLVIVAPQRYRRICFKLRGSKSDIASGWWLWLNEPDLKSRNRDNPRYTPVARGFLVSAPSVGAHLGWCCPRESVFHPWSSWSTTFRTALGRDVSQRRLVDEVGVRKSPFGDWEVRSNKQLCFHFEEDL